MSSVASQVSLEEEGVTGVIGRLVFRSHAIQRMLERRIHPSDVRRILEIGEIAEDYSDGRIRVAWYSDGPNHGLFT